MDILSIRNEVQKLILTHGTRNPIRIAEKLPINLAYDYLGNNINGYYTCNFRIHTICINNGLFNISNFDTFTAKDEMLPNIVCGHEIGHYILKHNKNSFFLRKYTFQKTNTVETESDYFTADLNISDDSVLDIREFNTKQISECLGVHERFVIYKIDILKACGVWYKE